MTQSKFSEFSDMPSTFFHLEAEKDKMAGQVIYYFDENYLIDILTCNNIVKENDKGLTAILEDALSKQ